MERQLRGSFLLCFFIAWLSTGAWSRVLEEDASLSSSSSLVEIDLGTSEIAVEGPREEVCAACQQLAVQITLFLNDPQTVKQIVAIVKEAACSGLAGNVEDMCEEAVEDYVPQFISVLQKSLNFEKLCGGSKICKKTTSLAIPEPNGVTLEKGARCDICLQVAYEALLQLEDAKTQEEMLEILHKACGRFKNRLLKDQCTSVVDDYFSQIVMILSSMTPEEFCHIIKYCDASHDMFALGSGIPEEERNVILANKKTALMEIRTKNKVGNPQECAACRFAIAQAKKKLKDPKNQEKLSAFLLDICGKTDVAYQQECKVTVEEYLPILFANIDTMVDPLKLCIKATLCPSGANFLSNSFDLPSIM